MSSSPAQWAAKGAVAATAVGLSLAMAAAFAPTALADPNAATAVPTGTMSAAIPGAVPFGDTDPSTPESVSFVLKLKGMPSLQNQVASGVSSYLSVGDFAKRYGQDTQSIAKLTNYLAQYGIKTQVLDDHLDVHATGTAAQFNAALSVQQKNYRVPGDHGNKQGSQVTHSPNKAPSLPGGVASIVTAILGLDNYAPYSSQAQKASDGVAADGTTPSSCPMSGVRLSACHLPSDYASMYGMQPMYDAGATGAGRTIGIVTLAALDEGAPEYFWNNVAHVPQTGRTVTVQNIDEGPGAPSDQAGTGETDLDVEQSGGVAPGANVVVYQAPNTDAGWFDAFATAATQNLADSVSSSWGYSETVTKYGVAAGWETAALQTAYDEIFLELAAQGQSTFLSSADQGAYTATADLGSTDLSADAPANSAYVTSAGGTTLPWNGTLRSADGSVTAPVSVTAERAWGWDYLWGPKAAIHGTSVEAAAKANIVGGGGGYSTLEARPSYQQAIPGIGNYSAVQYLTPTDYVTQDGYTAPTDWSFNPTPAVTHGTAQGRVEPDLSADADPYSGYLMYEPSADPADGTLQAGWGGTSFVAPQFNGSAAVMDSYLGHRVGLWNPALYKLAQGKNSPVTPLDTAGTSNDNLFYSGTPGTIYNPATGLGTPNLSLFAQELGRP